jgi:preprotein translocase subunit SecD
MKGLTWRLVAVVFAVVFSFYLLIPTILKFGFGKQVPRVVKDSDPWYYHVIPTEALKLGLDLKGGLHLVLGIDFDEVNRTAAQKLKSQLNDLATQEKLTGLTFESTKDNKVVITFADEATWKKMDDVIAKFMGRQVDFEGQSSSQVTVRLSESHAAEVKTQAIEQAVETLRNRIDEFGISEPIITRHGTDKILVQFPGVTETTRLKDIISRTAKLSFQIVRSGPEVPEGPPAADQLKTWVDEFTKTTGKKLDSATPMSVYLREINTWLDKKLPKGTELLFSKHTNINTREAEYIPYLVDREPLVTGEDLADASMGFDSNTNLPEVNFTMTPLGAGKFEKATGENVGKMMAIVLDGSVHSAPRIKDRIGGGRARIEMGGGDRSPEQINTDAKDTALVLRSGALPARLLFLEERVIGPALGADAVRSGTLSLLGGVCLVFLFMGLYYRTSGWFANTALALNGLFTLACMAAFEGTLSLPGLAGLTLGLGMSVDANVLIFEHMREELRLGRPLHAAISEAYTQAFAAIFDSNTTTVIAAVVLLEFGYGPIKGFAVTLVIGVISSMFTAVYVTRMMYDILVLNRNRKTIGV